MKFKIIRDKDYLHKKTLPVASIEEGQKIADELIAVLDELKLGIGLSAIQVGIPKSVSIVRARKDSPPVILMNPVIKEYGTDKIIYIEGCLSIPGKAIPTVRSHKVTVETLNHVNPLTYAPDVDPPTKESIPTDYGLLEAICVQHEIDHCNGILITDPGIRFIQSVVKNVKHGRNDKVVVEKNGETQYIKYKKALDLVSDGWKII
jgi:peptide deformylase